MAIVLHAAGALRDRQRASAVTHGVSAPKITPGAPRRAHRRTGRSRRRSPRRRSGARRVPGFGQRVLNEGVKRLVGLTQCPASPVRHELQRQRPRAAPCSSASFLVVGRENEPHRQSKVNALRGERQPFAQVPPVRECPARPERAVAIHLVACVNGSAFGRALHFDIAAFAPVITTFMSVSQAESSTYSRSSSGVRRGPACPPRPPPRSIANGRCARSCPAASSQLTASCAATKAPVMAAVRVPPSACSTSQSSEMVRSPSAFRSNTQRMSGRSGAGSPACARFACHARPRGRCGCGWRAAACRIRR